MDQSGSHARNYNQSGVLHTQLSIAEVEMLHEPDKPLYEEYIGVEKIIDIEWYSTFCKPDVCMSLHLY